MRRCGRRCGGAAGGAAVRRCGGGPAVRRSGGAANQRIHANFNEGVLGVQLIPVFDIKGGRMVHAVGGQRENYRAVKSKLFKGSSPLGALDALCNIGFDSFYVADLDAITRNGDNFELIKQLLLYKKIKLWLDAGVAGQKDTLGPHFRDLCFNERVNVILGSETLRDFESLQKMADAIGYNKVVFSLDIVRDRVLSPNNDIAALRPTELAKRVHRLGVGKIIIIDLVNVGSGSGPNFPLIENLTRELPEASFYPGGGVRNTEDLIRLKGLNVAGKP